MSRDGKTSDVVIMARLLNLPAPFVYQELKAFSETHSVSRLSHGSEIEEALLRRNDRLITLGLAQYGISSDVVSAIYKLGTATTGDAGYNKALRIAALGNVTVAREIMGGNKYGVLTDEEVLHYLYTDRDDETDELSTILRNPGAKKLLDALYNQEKPFDRIPPEKYLRAVAWSNSNPAIREDESNEYGPDMDAYGIGKGILRLMQTLPVDDDGFMAAFWLLKYANPRRVGICHEDPTPLFKRWQAVQLSERFRKYSHGEAGSIEIEEEFLCMLGALYGWYSTQTKDGQSKITYLGRFDAPELYLRCAYYARERKLTPEQMERAYSRDADAFMVAILYNDALFWNPKTRAVLEKHISGWLIDRYKKRCDELQKAHREFDANPISEHGKALLEDEDAPPPTEEQKRLERLETMATANAAQINRVYKMLTWVLIIAIIAVLLIWNRR